MKRLHTAPVILATSVAMLFSACTASSMEPGPTPAAYPIEPTGLSKEEVRTAYLQKEPFSCAIGAPGDLAPVKATILGDTIRLEKVKLSSDQKDGIVVYDGSSVYVWNNGSPTGWQIKVTDVSELPVFIEAAHSFGMNIPDVSNADQVEQLSESGYAVDCETVTIPPDAFIPPTTVAFTDITTSIHHTLQMGGKE